MAKYDGNYDGVYGGSLLASGNYAPQDVKYREVIPLYTVEQLTEAVEITTPTGEVLVAEADDWLLTDTRGNMRIEKDHNFKTFYTPMVWDVVAHAWVNAPPGRAQRELENDDTRKNVPLRRDDGAGA